MAGLRRAHALLGNLTLLGVSLAVCLSVAELALRVASPAPTVYRVLSPGLEAVIHPNHSPGVQGPSQYRVNSMGARSRELSPVRASEYRILCIGGSTTEGLETDQSRIWTTLLERKLDPLPDGRRVWVGNVGRRGVSSRHHVLQMSHLLEAFDPDCVLMLVGVNDLSRRLIQGDAYDPGFARQPENQLLLMRESLAVFPGQFGSESPDDPWFKRTRLWRLLRLTKYRVLRRSEIQDPEGRSYQRWREYRAGGGRTSQLPDLAAGLEEYAANLREIVRLARARSVRLLFATQPVLWRAGLREPEKALLWLGGVGDFQSQPGATYYEPEALAVGMEAYNQRLLAVCRETGTECVDLAAAVPRTTEYFWDDCHFTDRGQALVADTLAAAVKPDTARDR